MLGLTCRLRLADAVPRNLRHCDSTRPGLSPKTSRPGLHLTDMLKGRPILSLTPSERSLRAAAGSHASWGRTADRAKRTAPARAALDQKFLDQADGDPQ